MKANKRRHPMVVPRATLADAVLANGQRLRADEAVNWATFLVSFAAKRAAEARRS